MLFDFVYTEGLHFATGFKIIQILHVDTIIIALLAAVIYRKYLCLNRTLIAEHVFRPFITEGCR